jgi:hypothetical protein
MAGNGCCARRAKAAPWESFVHSTKDILARCMREKGCPPEDVAVLLAALRDRFVEAPEVPKVQKAPEGVALEASAPASSRPRLSRPMRRKHWGQRRPVQRNALILERGEMGL